MCGIFGILINDSSYAATSKILENSLKELFSLSETRGREAAGLVVKKSDSVYSLKQAITASDFIKLEKFNKLIDDVNFQPKGQQNFVVALGHSRLVTNGFQSKNENNQPVIVRGAAAVHNGIITNEAQLWQKHPELDREFEIDTEVFVKIIERYFSQNRNIEEATIKAFSEVEGSVSIACILEGSSELLLATNTGSLFYVHNEKVTLFASERFILASFLKNHNHNLGLSSDVGIHQLKAGTAIRASFDTGELLEFSLDSKISENSKATQSLTLKSFSWFDRSSNLTQLRRCTKCILPETYPCIDFDSSGICNYCRHHKQIAVKGPEALARFVEPYRSKNGSPDCIVAFSGGRDSCYGLHYMKKELGMNPVAFTFDWGLVTDLARRNQARLCSKLGVEHIIRAADIPTKRRYVRKNVEAWLNKPELGMVTLFTAGDKEFYHYARELRKETGIDLIIFCTGNMIEDTPYKTGFCGFLEKDHAMTLTNLAPSDKFQLLWYYFKQYLKNPGYWNESLKDTLMAYWHTFVKKEDFLWLYHYLPWDEKTIVDTLINDYNWEVAKDTKTTWRIGDGTAAFYNYIYTSMAGFSEDDVMISNMIREGMLSREEGLARGDEFRKPRYESLREYGQLIGLNIDEALVKIDSAPKLF
ncbi:MAG: hypothetical protein KA116_10645 [Proteobacteria bacterium]|nr:hypothetical protein [Pseudomonadota bacterium]